MTQAFLFFRRQLPLRQEDLGICREEEPLQVWCWSRLPGRCPVFLTSSVALSPPSRLSVRSPLGLFQPPLCLYLSFPWDFIDKYLFHHLAAKMKRNIPPLLIPNSRLRWSNTHLLHQLPSASLWVLSIMSEVESRRAELLFLGT